MTRQKIDPSEKYGILFVCSGNSCRSPMAEGVLKSLIPEGYKNRINISSAGTLGLFYNPATEPAIEVAAEHGVDIRAHRSQGITEKLMQESNLIIAMARVHDSILKKHFPQHRRKIVPLKTFARKGEELDAVDIADPIGQSKNFYREIFLEIESELKRVLPAILREVDEYRKSS